MRGRRAWHRRWPGRNRPARTRRTMMRPGPGERSWSDWPGRSRAGAISPISGRATGLGIWGGEATIPADSAAAGFGPAPRRASSAWRQILAAQAYCLAVPVPPDGFGERWRGSGVGSLKPRAGDLTARARPSPRAPCRAWFLTWRKSAGAGLRQGTTLRLRSAPAGPSAGLTPSAPRTGPARRACR
jgi:hypothetical protein